MKYVLIILAALTLTACASTPKVEYVYKTELRPIDLPSDMLLPCKVTTPPDKDEYVSMDAQQKEETLTNYTIELIKNLGDCNEQIHRIKSVRDEQIRVYQDLKKSKQE